MQVPPSWAEEPCEIALWIDPCLGFPSLWVEPVSDVCTCRSNNGFTQFIVVLLDEFREIINLIKKGNPTISGSVVFLDLSWSVISSDLERLRYIFGLFKTGGFREARGGNSCSH